MRQQGQHPLPFEYHILGQIPSFMNFVYRYLYQQLSERLHIDEGLIDFNLTRLDETLVTMITHQNQQYWTDEQQKCKSDRFHPFDAYQWALALEIFLQVDGNHRSSLLLIPESCFH